MPDIGDLLTSRSASCIQLLTDTQLLCKKNIVLIIVAIVLSFEVDGDVSLIYHKRIDFCTHKNELGSFVSVSIFVLMAEQLFRLMVGNSL